MMPSLLRGDRARRANVVTVVLLAGLAGLAGVTGASFIAACTNRDGGFESGATARFQDDAGTTGTCPVMCSVDGRNVVDSCTGAIVESCADNQACGAGVCQEPCAAAAADRRSDGCEFYMQPPRFTRGLDRGCYAAYIVNGSLEPLRATLELDGETLDISKSVYDLGEGSLSLSPHSGDIAPGASVVLFISDKAADEPATENYVACPDGVEPATRRDVTPDQTGIGSSLHLVTNLPAHVATIYPFGGAKTYIPSATLVLPVATWGKEHILINGWDNSPLTGGAAAQIMASENDTEITIVPRADIAPRNGVEGAMAGTPVTYRLEQGQHLQLVQWDELTGSIVTANKPIGMVGGHQCAYIPNGARLACDILGQQIPAFEQWGNEYAAIGYGVRGNMPYDRLIYRVVGGRDGTKLSYDPAIPVGAPVELHAGEAVAFAAGTDEGFVVRSQDSEHPFYMAAYMGGGSSTTQNWEQAGWTQRGDMLDDINPQGEGDPEFVNVIPTGQFLNRYTFVADPTYDETNLVVIRERARDGTFKDVTLECAGVLGDFRPIGTEGRYEYTRVPLRHYGEHGLVSDAGVCDSGVHRMHSAGSFTATIWGWDYYASYAYPGGQAQRKLVAVPLAQVR